MHEGRSTAKVTVRFVYVELNESTQYAPQLCFCYLTSSSRHISSLLGAALDQHEYAHQRFCAGVLSGLFTAMAFVMSVLWMNILSAEMVRSWKVLGYIHGVSQVSLSFTAVHNP